MRHYCSLAKSAGLVFTMLFLIGCNTLFSISTDTAVPTNHPIPIITPIPTPPAYSEVIKTYPSTASFCKTVVDVTEVGPNGDPTSFEGTFYGFDFKCYGIQLTAKVPVTVNGVQYPIGTRITVDAEQNYIVVSSWD